MNKWLYDCTAPIYMLIFKFIFSLCLAYLIIYCSLKKRQGSYSYYYMFQSVINIGKIIHPKSWADDLVCT